jgi:asparagine synthase (glutamine-hydrolysing)
MIGALAHRGPDGYGLYRDERVGLAHSRLSLIDLAGGAQPIHNGDGSVWITFNGEIFNYVELRQELVSLGHKFYTDGDTEVIVHCYEQYGPKAWAMLNGQFAFALWDRRRRTLWLVRDRFGIVPLHYAVVDGHLVFASEAKALFAGGRIAPEFSPQGLVEAFTRWSAAAPRSIFDGVKQVPPASALCFSADLSCTASRFWRPDAAATSELSALSDDEIDERLDAQLKRSVMLRLRADVPVGCYVSGGLDSSLISSLAKDQHGGRLDTFGIRFEDPAFDETAEQRVMANALKSEHREFLCGAADICNALDRVIWHCEMPLLRTAPVPLFLLASIVRANGMRTVLTGEGADELFAGYSIFKEDQIRRFWARQPDSRLRPMLLSQIHHYVGGADARSTQLWQNFFRQGLTDTDHPFYSHLIRWHNNAWTLRLLAPEIRDSLSFDQLMADQEAQMPPGWREFDSLTRGQLIEIQSFMSSYLLSCQGDRVAMANGVEGRYPFLDPGVVDMALALPKRHKLTGKRDKVALRRLAARRLPPAIWQRRKQPYRAPIGSIVSGAEGMERFGDVLSEDALRRSGLFETRAATQLVKRASRLDGKGLGEREEMGLIGVLTLSLLDRHFHDNFPARIAEGRNALKRLRCDVFADQSGSPAPNAQTVFHPEKKHDGTGVGARGA